MSLLKDLLEFIRDREQLPLSWVVGNENKFQQAWAKSSDPETMLRIAGRSVSRTRVVSAACVIARMVLPKNPCVQLTQTLEVIEAWTRNRANLNLVESSRYWVLNSPACSEVDQDAAAATVRKVAEIASHGTGFYHESLITFALIAARRRNGKSAAVTAAYKKLFAKVIREHIPLTIHDLVRAGKNGWQP